MKIAIVVGHNKNAKGAYANEALVEGVDSTAEFDFNNLIADEMVRRSESFMMWFSGVGTLEVKRFNRPSLGSYTKEIKAVYGEVNDWGADASMELHFNWASRSYVSGALCLSSGSRASVEFAQITQRYMETTMGLGTFPPGVEIRRSGRGAASLKAGRAPAILTEPFFGTNPEAISRVQKLGVKGFANMYFEAVLEFAKLPSPSSPAEPDPEREPTRRNLFGSVKLKTEGLSKNEFFTNNFTALESTVTEANQFIQVDKHGEEFNQLSLLDIFGVMNAEMGMKGGLVDPEFEHSEGEKGLMPLPDNLQFWNGEDAPEEDEDLSLEENVSEFITYLGAIKNRPLWRKHGEVPFYHGLFGEDVDEAGQLHLLAAVVHGWFTPYTYPSGANPDFIAIAEKTKIAHQEPAGPLPLLKEFGYVNATRNEGSIVTNRLKNLNEIIASPPTSA